MARLSGRRDDVSRQFTDVFGTYKLIVEALCREYGVFNLSGGPAHRDRDYSTELANFILQTPEAEKVLDAVELSFRCIDRLTRKYEYLRRHAASDIADAAIDELNVRLREHGVGFQFVEGDIIRIDS